MGDDDQSMRAWSRQVRKEVSDYVDENKGKWELEDAQKKGTGGFPAAVVGDHHSCSQKFHVGGPVTGPGATHEKIQGKKAVRFGDHAWCTGEEVEDTIFEGEESVKVGGLPLARVYHKTIHGGVLLGPGVPTVLHGPPKGDRYPKHALKGGKLVTEYNKFTTIEGNTQYQGNVVEDYDKFYATKVGKEVLNEYDRLSKLNPPQTKHTTVRPYTGLDFAGQTSPDDPKAAKNRDPKNGPVGSDVVINYNPTASVMYEGKDAKGKPQTGVMSGWEILGHEQIHALHACQGELYGEHQCLHGKGKNDKISEAEINKEQGKPIRTDYKYKQVWWKDANGKWRTHTPDGNPMDPPEEKHLPPWVPNEPHRVS